MAPRLLFSAVLAVSAGYSHAQYPDLGSMIASDVSALLGTIGQGVVAFGSDGMAPGPADPIGGFGMASLAGDGPSSLPDGFAGRVEGYAGGVLGRIGTGVVSLGSVGGAPAVEPVVLDPGIPAHRPPKKPVRSSLKTALAGHAAINWGSPTPIQPTPIGPSPITSFR